MYFRFLENLGDPVREEGLRTGIQIWPVELKAFLPDRMNRTVAQCALLAPTGC